MSKLNLLVYLNSYSDESASNSPSHNNFKWARDLNQCMVSNPQSFSAALAPGETRSLFSGLRTIDQDSTTVYSISLVPLSANTYQLSATAGTLPNFRTPRTTGADATTEITVTVNGPVITFSGPSIGFIAASFVGTLAGMSTSVTITANNKGTGGNAIVITPDGTSTVATLISNWNTANPLNMVTLTLGDGTQIPTGGTFTFSGGTNSTALNLSGVVVGDQVIIGNNFNPLNQGTYTIIASTSTSFSVQNDLGSAEGPINLGSGFATQLQIFGSAGVQIGDTLVISGGFSIASQGSYKITQVSAESVQFYSTSVLPQESGIMTEAINIYSSAKQFIYLEADSKVNVILNGTNICDIEPFIISNSSQPGVFMLKSTVYSLSLQNSGLSPANVFFASVE